MRSATSTVNLVQKSQLARLLATENMIIEHSKSAKTASFDTNTRKLILPIWSKATEDVYDMLVAHEVGHALITPRQEIYMPVCARMSPGDPTRFFPYLNIIEDIRVDNEIKDRYPGARRSYYNAYTELINKDFFQIAKYGGDLSSLSFGDRLNLYSKVGHLGFIDVPFDADEQLIVDEAMRVASFDDVIAAAEKVWNLSKQRQDKQPEPQGQDSMPDQDTGEGDGGDERESAGNDSSNENGKTGEGNNKQGQDSKDQSDQNQSGTTMNSGAVQSQSKPISANSAAPALKTVDTLAKNLSKLTKSDPYSDEYHYYDLPRMNLENIIFPYSKVISDLSPMRALPGFCGDKIYAAVQDRNKNFVSNLVKQFEQKMAADEYRRTRSAKTGQLNMRKIANYKFSDDLFVKNQITADGKSHGMVFIMDWSGSMSEYLLPTAEQLLALCMFCRKMNIPFEVYAFTTAQPYVPFDYESHGMTGEQFNDLQMTKGSCSPDYIAVDTTDYYGGITKKLSIGNFLSVQHFGMIQFLSSKMSSPEFKNAAELFCQCARNCNSGATKLAELGARLPACGRTDMNEKYRLSQTPLNEAIFASMSIVNRFKTANRLDIVNTVILTDGEPSTTLTGYLYGGGVSILNLPNRKQMVIKGDKTRTVMGSTVDEMIGLAKVFREVTGTNLISIRLSRGREATYLARILSNSNKAEEERMIKEWKEHDFFSYKNFGFTESFVIDSGTEVAEDDFFDNIKSDASVGMITRAFIKGNAKKASSRVLLNRFADLIAKKILT